MPWKVTQLEKHWLQLERRETPEDEPDYVLDIKWDGCCHITRKGFGGPDKADYLHVCDFPELVAELVEAARLAWNHFGSEDDSWWVRQNYPRP